MNSASVRVANEIDSSIAFALTRRNCRSVLANELTVIVTVTGRVGVR